MMELPARDIREEYPRFYSKNTVRYKETYAVKWFDVF